MTSPSRGGGQTAAASHMVATSSFNPYGFSRPSSNTDNGPTRAKLPLGTRDNLVKGRVANQWALTIDLAGVRVKGALHRFNTPFGDLKSEIHRIGGAAVTDVQLLVLGGLLVHGTTDEGLAAVRGIRKLGGQDVEVASPKRTFGAHKWVVSGLFYWMKEEDVKKELERDNELTVTSVTAMGKSGTFLIQFGDEVIVPQTVHIDRWRELKPYIEPAPQCVKCWQYWHGPLTCRRKKVCRRCGDRDHDFGHCRLPFGTWRCLFCVQNKLSDINHRPGSGKCPTHRHQMAIMKEVQINGMDIDKAKDKINQQRHQQQSQRSARPQPPYQHQDRDYPPPVAARPSGPGPTELGSAPPDRSTQDQRDCDHRPPGMNFTHDNGDSRQFRSRQRSYAATVQSPRRGDDFMDYSQGRPLSHSAAPHAAPVVVLSQESEALTHKVDGLQTKMDLLLKVMQQQLEATKQQMTKFGEDLITAALAAMPSSNKNAKTAVQKALQTVIDKQAELCQKQSTTMQQLFTPQSTGKRKHTLTQPSDQKAGPSRERQSQRQRTSSTADTERRSRSPHASTRSPTAPRLSPSTKTPLHHRQRADSGTQSDA